MTHSATLVLSILPSWLDPQVIIQSLGGWALLAVCLIIFAECGLLIGFFLPGDSLLFVTGLMTMAGVIETPLWLVCVLLAVAAVAGNVSGYGIGYRAGPAVFDRPDSRLFKQENVERTQRFFDKYGNRAIVLARFVPIVRTFITVMAGVGRMEFRRYLTFSAIGGVLWAVGVTLLGAALGQIAFVRNHIELILVAVVLLSVVPIGIEALRARRENREAAGADAPAVPLDQPTERIPRQG